jgi:hypothetical protein
MVFLGLAMGTDCMAAGAVALRSRESSRAAALLMMAVCWKEAWYLIDFSKSVSFVGITNKKVEKEIGVACFLEGSW